MASATTSFRVLSSAYRPRQFEFHPDDGSLVFGTLSGEMCLVNASGEQEQGCLDSRDAFCDPIRYLGNFGRRGLNTDAILGICWLRGSPDKFVTGSSYGEIKMGTTNPLAGGGGGGGSGGGPAGGTGAETNRWSNPCVVKRYEPFDKLTSIHINSDNRYILTSGYTMDARIYDLETSKVLAKYGAIHESHVNISRFCNLSPFVFATSSFDSTCKLWDLRLKQVPIYTVHCNSGLVMINFSPDDTFLLASALDNEITQFLTVDGRTHTTYDLPKTDLEGNFTRSYYSTSGSYVVTGACEEQSVRLLCAASGQVLSSTEIYPQRKHSSLYIQSLRGSPASDESFAVLANYRDLPNREIILVQMQKTRALDRLAGGGAGDASSSASSASSSDLTPTATIHLPSPALADMMHGLRQSAQSVSIGLRAGALASSAAALSHHMFDYDPDTLARAGVDVILFAGLHPTDSQAHSQTHSQQFATGAHLFVLLSRCPAFAALLAAPKAGEGPAPVAVICLDNVLAGVDPKARWDVATILLEYVYCGDAAIDMKSVRAASLAHIFADAPAPFFTSLFLDEFDEQQQQQQEEDKAAMGRRWNQVRPLSALRRGLRIAAAADEALWRAPAMARWLVAFVEQLISAASAMGLERLLAKLQAVAAKCIFPHTVVDVLRLAESFGLAKLRAKCLHFLTYHLHVCNAPDALGPVFSPLQAQVEALRAAVTVPAIKVPSEALAISPDAYKRMLKAGRGLPLMLASNAATAEGTVTVEDEDEDGEGKWEDAEEEDEDGEDGAGAGGGQDSDENTQLWLRRGSGDRLASWVSEMPRYYGHVWVQGPSDLLLVIGGRDRTRYHYPRLVTAYHPPSAAFSMLDIGDGTMLPSRDMQAPGVGAGIAPQLNPEHAREHNMLSLIFHAAAPLRERAGRHVLICGGFTDHETTGAPGATAGPEKFSRPLLLLDTQTMTWSRPARIGYCNLVSRRLPAAADGGGLEKQDRKMCSRLRHSMCVVYPSGPKDAWTAPPPASASGSPSSEGAGSEVLSAVAARFAPLAARGEDDYLKQPASSIRAQFIIFGGLQAGEAGHHATFFGDAKFLLAIAAQMQSDQDEQEPLLCWVVPPITSGIVAARVPQPRIHHSACIANLPESRGGVRHLIFGGLGAIETLGDLKSLRLGNFARYASQEVMGDPSVGDVLGQWSLEWEEVVVVSGDAPSRRYGHTMTACTLTDGEEVYVLVGGSNDAQNQLPLSDVWILHIVDAGRSSALPQLRNYILTVRWERVRASLDAPLKVAPQPRMLHQAISVRPGHVLIFGGCHGMLNNSYPEQSCVYELRVQRQTAATTACRWGYNSAVPAAEAGEGGGCPDRQVEVRSEPTTTLSTDCLHSDLLELFRGARRCDLKFVLGPDCAPIWAHKALVARRCDVLKTMMEWQRERCGEGPEDDACLSLCVLDDEAPLPPPELEGDPQEADPQEAEQQRLRQDGRRRVFSAMLDFLYSDTLLCAADDVTSLLSLSNRYQLSRLSQLCEAFLSRQVSDDSAGPLLQYADWYTLDTLKAVCFSQILRLPNSGAEGAAGAVGATGATGAAGDTSLHGLGLGGDLEHLSPELRQEIDAYRREKRHVYLGSHRDNVFIAELGTSSKFGEVVPPSPGASS